MEYSESDYIEICKKLLEQKFSFGNGHGYTQKDLELLSNYIEEETGVYISLSTLKRLWKNNFKKGPQLATLNALVNILGYNNWQHFKLENKKSSPKEAPVSFPGTKNRNTKLLKFLAGIGAAFLIFSLFIWSKSKIEDIPKAIEFNGPFTFKANKTLSKGTPNTVIFNYDVSNIKADSFFIQQSWNNWRRRKIDPTKKVHSEIYYEAGYHRAKLYANDSIISKIGIHILSDGWEPHIYYGESNESFIHFRGETFNEDGYFHLSKELLDKMNVDLTRNFKTRVSHSAVYDVSSNNFSLEARAKLDLNTNKGRSCPRLKLFIVTEVHIFYLRFVQKGCETQAEYKLGEVYRKGINNDLSLLGRDLFEWQDIKVRVENKNAQVFINDSLAFSEVFKQDFGDVVGLFFMFDGTGNLDDVKLTDHENRVVFQDDFEK